MEQLHIWNQTINQIAPSRYKRKQKRILLDYLESEGAKLDYSPQYIKSKLSTSLVFGDLNHAKIIISAHYDTPFFSRHLTFITRLFGYWTGQFILVFPILLLLALISSLSAQLISGIGTLLPDSLSKVASIIISLLSALLCIFCLVPFTFYNPHNANDNTSGVLGVLSLMKQYRGNNNIAFVFFDNEEWGLLGSASFAKNLKNKDVDVLNFDCIGLGEEIGLVNKKSKLIKAISLALGERKHKVFSKYTFPSDHINFKHGCGVFIYSKAIVTRDISLKNYHSPNDKVIDLANIEFVCQSVIKGIDIFSKEEKYEK